MTEADVLHDISYLKSVAEEGRNAPLLGGRIGLMWTGLLVPALMLHGLTAMGKGPLTIDSIGAMWMAYGVIGGVLSLVMVRTLKGQPGESSIANKVESLMWPVTAMLIFGYAIAIAFGHTVLDLPPIMFSGIMPLAFALSAVNLALLSRLTGQSYFTLCSVLAGVSMIACTLLLNRPELYFAAAGGVLLTGVLPNLLQIRTERRGR